MMLFNERPGIVLRYLALCPLRGCDGPCWGSIPANFARVYGFTDSRRDGPNQREGHAGIRESKRGRLATPRHHQDHPRVVNQILERVEPHTALRGVILPFNELLELARLEYRRCA